MAEYSCNGICLRAHEIGLPGSQIAISHPECDLHGYSDPPAPWEEEMLPEDWVR